jgi:hypothetical protein
MNHSALLVASLLVVIALPRPAWAQASRPHKLTPEVFLNVGVGHVFRPEGQSFGTAPDIGGGLGVSGARFGVEFSVSHLSEFAQLVAPCAFPGCQGSSLSSVTLVSANVRYYVAGTRVRPYVTGGAGGFWSRATHTVVTGVGNIFNIPALTVVEDHDASVALNVGGGVRIAAGKWFSLRPEVRFYDSIGSRQNLSVILTSVNAAFSW